MDIPTLPPWPSLAVVGTDRRFPVRRILCIGKNYADHVKEMGGDGREPPVHFTKSPDALLAADGPVTMAYPPGTSNLHHEVELVVLLGAGGADLSPDAALACVYGYAIGLDMTRRDLQSQAKAKGGPWDAGKDFDQAAIVGPVHPAATVGHPSTGAITLSVDGQLRQQGTLDQMTWSVPELLSALSRLGVLRAGDLVFTGTPAGVGPVVPGQQMVAAIDTLGELTVDVA